MEHIICLGHPVQRYMKRWCLIEGNCSYVFNVFFALAGHIITWINPIVWDFKRNGGTLENDERICSIFTWIYYKLGDLQSSSYNIFRKFMTRRDYMDKLHVYIVRK